MGHRKERARRPLAIVGTAALVLAFSACGKATETGMEQLIESQGGGKIDLDSGDGGFSMQTEDGGMRIDKDGNFVITDADGSVITGRADSETGEFSMESDEGGFRAGATTELPDEWPSSVPEPKGLAISSATVIGSNAEQAINVSGTVASGDFVTGYGKTLQSAGFDEDSTFKSGDTINNVYSNDEWTVGITYFGDSGEKQTTVSVYRAD